MPEWQEGPLGLMGLHVLWPEGAPGLQYRHRARCGAAHTTVGLPVRPGARCWQGRGGCGGTDGVPSRGEGRIHITSLRTCPGTTAPCKLPTCSHS